MAFYAVSSTDIGVLEIPCKKGMGSCIWFSVGDFIHLFFLVRQLMAHIHHITSTGLLFLPSNGRAHMLSGGSSSIARQNSMWSNFSLEKANSPPSLFQAVFLNRLHCPHAGMGVSGQQEGRAELFSTPQESYKLDISEVVTPLGKSGESCRADAGFQASVSNTFSLKMNDWFQ